MKKIMILMLSLAVLFSFAACDNSSTTPAGGDDQTVDTSDYAYVAASDSDVQNMLGEVASKFATSVALMTDGEYLDDYTGDLAANSFTYETRTAGVNGLPETYTVITVSGRDVTAEATAKAGTGKTILLDEYTISFSIDGPYAVLGNLDPITGVISGDIIGLVEITGLEDGEIGDSTDMAIKVPASPVLAGLTGKVPTVVTAFLPADAADVESLSYAGHDVVAADFVAYINNSTRVNTNNAEYTAITTPTASIDAYKAYQTKEYSTAVYGNLSGAIKASTGGFTALVKEDTGAISTKITIGSVTGTASSLEITYTNSTENDVVVATDGTVHYAVPGGKSLTVLLEGKSTSASKFVAETYTINGVLNAYKAATPNTDNVYGDYTSITVTDLKGNLDTTTAANVTFEEGETVNGVKAVKEIPADFTFANDSKADIASGTIDVTINAKVMPGFAGEGENTTLAALGAISIDCSKQTNV